MTYDIPYSFYEDLYKHINRKLADYASRKGDAS
jgi:hypothetical protein